VGEWVGEWGNSLGYRDSIRMTISAVDGDRVEGTTYVSCSGCTGAGFNRDSAFVATIAGNALTIPRWRHWSPLTIQGHGAVGSTITGTFGGHMTNSFSLTKITGKTGSPSKR
jgi:hypothetical protein